jgi:ATP-dependent DNA helicase DinG
MEYETHIGIDRDTPSALAARAGRAAWRDPDGTVETLAPVRAAERLARAAPLVVHLRATARRLGSDLFPAWDLMELFAFVRPARFCAPSPTGLALSLGSAEPKSAEEQAAALREAAGLLLRELTDPAYPEREAAYVLALTMQRAGWAWGERVVQALEAGGVRARQHRGSGMDVWSRLTEWEDEAPRGEARHAVRRARGSQSTNRQQGSNA